MHPQLPGSCCLRQADEELGGQCELRQEDAAVARACGPALNIGLGLGVLV